MSGEHSRDVNAHCTEFNDQSKIVCLTTSPSLREEPRIWQNKPKLTRLISELTFRLEKVPRRSRSEIGSEDDY
jgi:hypothetical protein